MIDKGKSFAVTKERDLIGRVEWQDANYSLLRMIASPYESLRVFDNAELKFFDDFQAACDFAHKRGQKRAEVMRRYLEARDALTKDWPND